MKQMSIMANPIMSGDSLVFLTTAHNRAMSSTVQNRLSTDTYVTQRPNLLRENGYSGSLNQCVLLFYTSNKRETFCVRSHTVKSIWKCRPPGGRHFDVGFINQALLAKVSLLDKVSFCGTVKPQPRPENPTDKMKKMSIMANPIMSGGSLVFLTTQHNRAMPSHVQNRLSTDSCLM